MIRTLKSNNFALAVAIISISAQLPHSIKVFISVSQIDSFWSYFQAILFAIAIDGSLLFYTLRNRRDVARFFAIVTAIINLMYYATLAGFNVQFAAGIIISILLPTAIFYYSEEIKDNTPPIATNGQAKHDDLQELKRMRGAGMSYNKIAKEVGSNQGSIYRKLNGKSK